MVAPGLLRGLRRTCGRRRVAHDGRRTPGDGRRAASLWRSRPRWHTARLTAPDELERLWEELAPDGGPPPIVLEGATVPMPTRYRVADAAAVSIGVALAAAVRWRGARQARLDVREAVAAFAAERSLRVDGRPVPLWDPLAGDHRALDGWVRLHTNYPHHRRAVLRVLGLAGRNVDRDLDQQAGRH